MNRFNLPVELLIEQPTPSPLAKKRISLSGAGDIKEKLKAADIEIEWVKGQQPTSHLPKGLKKKISPTSGVLRVKTKVRDTEVNPWDMAHMAAGALTPGTFIEPDMLNEYAIGSKTSPLPKTKAKFAAKAKDDSGYDRDWPPSKNIVWHLGNDYSQLKAARESVANINYPIRIAHFDTGYSLTHPIISAPIKNNPLQRNFVDGESVTDAHDPMKDGMLKMPGHGTGTVALLAGGKIKLPTDEGDFNDYLGGAWFADIVCCRIASSVVLLKTSAFADALNYITQLTRSGTPIHVLSMSMGGAPSKAWTRAVNAAYDAGITLVTAAGNNFNGLPTSHLVYPGKYGRVIAACGVTQSFKPYSSKKLGEMQGCFGPKRAMKKALAAFTPNVPWASISTKSFKFSGAGTSSATPQIAAAAAIYYRKYHAELDALEPWQRVEAIRHALYTSSLKKVNAPGHYSEYFGNGILQANAALNVPVNKKLPKTEEDSTPWFPILATIFKARSRKPTATMEMYNTELAQLVFNQPELAAIIDNEERPYDKVSAKKWKKFGDAVIAHPAASMTLKSYLKAKKG